MSAGYNKAAAAADEFFTNNFGLRTIEQLAVEHFLKLGISTRDRVSDDGAVTRNVRILGLIALHYLDPKRFKLSRHRRIYILVGTGDPVPAGLQHPGERSHCSSANSYQVVMHMRKQFEMNSTA
jgi:hypothetical protein